MAWPMQRQKRFEEKRLLAANKNKNIFFFIIENMFGSTLKYNICLRSQSVQRIKEGGAFGICRGVFLYILDGVYCTY